MAAPRTAPRAAPRAAKGPRIPVLAWTEARPAPVVLVSGTESLLADRAGSRIRQALVAADPDTEVSDLDAATAAPGDLSTAVSPSLFGEGRLVRVAGLERLSDAFLEETLRYLEHPAEGAVLVLRHGGGQRGKRLLDAIRGGAGGGVEVDCAELKRDADRSAFAAGEFHAAGRRISPGALRTLVSAFQADLAELASACQQLIADAPGDIDEQVVDTYYAGRTETTAFAVADAALAGRRGQALVLLRHAIAQGADPVPIVAALAAKVRAMAKVAGERGSGADVARALGMAPWQVDRARRDAEGWSPTGLGHAIEALAATDEQVKGGARDPEFAVERLVTLLAARGGPD